MNQTEAEETSEPEKQTIKYLEKTETKEFTAYVGFLTIVVCTSLSLEDAEIRLNRLHPSGTSAGWVGQKERSLHCDKYPDTHKHFVFHC